MICYLQLYRCYDSRLSATERSPALYGVDLQPTRRRFETKNGSCNTILEIKDESPKQYNDTSVRPFEDLLDSQARMEWLWMFFGQVKVFSTEFHEGAHYAKQPEHFIPIIDHLEQLHENGYVHGDIRAYNMVLNYPECEIACRTQLLEGLDGQIYVYNLILDFAGCQKAEGWLIDFDFGGKIIGDTGKTLENSTEKNQHQNPKYPKGYYHWLSDGFRLGREGENITYDHDWYALGHVIFSLHELVYPENFKDFDLHRAIDGYYYINLKDRFQRDFCLKLEREDFHSLEGGPAKYLRDYLQLLAKNGFNLKPGHPLRFALKEKYIGSSYGSN
jgi:serine/threonine protein kinase